MAKYILKGTDPMYYNSWGYWIKGLDMSFGQIGSFLEDSCFNSKNEAKRQLHRMMHPRKGKWKWLRTGITYRNFEIITLVKCQAGKFTWWIDPAYKTPKEFLGK